MAESMTIEQKVKHFLTLAEDKGATQEERDLASKQAERLMLKHAIDAAMLDGLDTSKPSEKITAEKLFIPGTYAYEVMLGHSSIVRALGLKAFFVDYRKYGFLDEKTWKSTKGCMLHVVGFESDVRDALVLLRSLETQAYLAVNAWVKIQPYFSNYTPREKYLARRNFLEGFGSGAARRIRETRREEIIATTGSELVLVDRAKKVEEHFEGLGLGTRKDRRQDTGTGRAAGYAAGMDSNVGGTQKAVR